MDGATAVCAEKLKDAMARVAGAVSVMTVGSGAERTGLTLTSVTSVSLEPPTLLFCINRSSRAWPVLQSRRCFGINVLAARHRRLADQFAGRMGHDGPGRYAGAQWRTLETGAAILADALIAFDCEVDEVISKHSHDIVIGRIRAVSTPSRDRRLSRSDSPSTDGRLATTGGNSPLLYWERNYEDIFQLRTATPDVERLACAFEL